MLDSLFTQDEFHSGVKHKKPDLNNLKHSAIGTPI